MNSESRFIGTKNLINIQKCDKSKKNENEILHFIPTNQDLSGFCSECLTSVFQIKYYGLV